MDRNQLMEAVEKRAFEARLSLYQLCAATGLSGTIATRWLHEKNPPLLPTIGKLEDKLAQLEAERAAA